ncbi:30S ribosomal protein S10 [Candidatus Vidania fulgoroideorum]
MIKIILESYSIKILNNYIIFFSNFLKKSSIFYKGPINIPYRKKFFTLLRSPHVDKKSRDQFEIRIYKKFFYILIYDKKFIKNLVVLNKPCEISFRLIYY